MDNVTMYLEYERLLKLEKEVEQKRKDFQERLFEHLEKQNPYADKGQTVSLDVTSPDGKTFRFNKIARNKVTIDEKLAVKVLGKERVSSVQRQDFKLDPDKFRDSYAKMTPKAKEIVERFVEMKSVFDDDLIKQAVQQSRISEEELLKVCKTEITYSMRVSELKQKEEIAYANQSKKHAG